MSSKKLIAVFGATGNQGGSVVKALAKTGLFDIRAITRNANSDKAKQLQSSYNASVVEANLDDKESVDKALKDCYGVFLVTDFSAHFEHKEVKQGQDAIDSAIKNGAKHFVFSGLDDVKSVTGKPCYHFDYKADIENYGLKQADKINFTSVRLSFYYENFDSICVTKVGDKQYIINAPMEGKPMFANSVDDIGEYVALVLQHPQEYKSKILGIAAEFLTNAQYAEILSKHLAPIKISDGGVTLEQYAQFKFPGVEDLVAMFDFYQTGKMQRDIELSKKLNKNLLSFEQWVIKNKDKLTAKLN